ncbi:2-oxo acid dehydrogenase subunit E2 [Lichenicola cladoniae]|uniref:Dihydrolipoamide acetyltransferase component of pyruvate dehydrogenase complex n=1 Tax=Lichenicola cladoniae TaxID=1484109 RepID=A0A6M8HRG2_9PROT|nr:dihydrolipoamide acetyltransferase family protein [Lichenicola cladoniae]NPD69049.1 2-oxo acid dehydrogenase subunit E2 [Acetobacteraceae bacterium]QKE90880.1 2-oxo acid dehydrogenase subunit E2 [Lichenicola cladoniae]
MDNYVIRLPDVGEGVAEAEIVVWHVGVGDRIEEDQPTIDIMTDKATVEMTTPVSGVVIALYGEIGQMVPVGAPLIELRLDGAGDQAPDVTAGLPVDALEGPETPTLPEVIAAVAAPAPIGEHVEAPLAAPATRHRADALGIALKLVPATGPDGRITPEDLDAYVARRDEVLPAETVSVEAGIKEIRIVGLRRRIAERMQEAKRRIPHFGYVEEFDLTELEALRRELNAGKAAHQPKLTLLPFFMRALVRTVPQFPQVNARFDDEAGILRTYDGVHVGIATQTEGGLLVPVVRHAEALDLWQSAVALERVVRTARDGSARREDLAGSTITLTSLGALGGVSATPVINHPEVAIIGPNKLMDRPMVINGQIVIRTMMNVSSSFDHRIVDGFDAARFVQGLKRLIERPALLFV